MFDGYGYGSLSWMENTTRLGHGMGHWLGDQRIGWNSGNDRMAGVFSTRDAWMPGVYELARDWGNARN